MVHVFIILVGLCIASFVGSLSYRVPRGISIVAPRSFCVHCKTTIRPYDLIPFFSYLILRGRCRSCNSRIAFKYFAAEVFVPLVYLGAYIKFGPGYEFFIYTYLLTVLVYLSIVDLDHRSLSLRDIVPCYAGGVAFLILSAARKIPYPPARFLYGALAASVLIGASYLIILALKKQNPMGTGDFLVVPGVALHFGVIEVVRALVFSSIVGVITGSVLFMTHRIEKNFRFPLMPFVTAGVAIEILLF
jgi:prepilin signal peptidase PulO-like enzyme (type II secretory pathway)